MTRREEENAQWKKLGMRYDFGALRDMEHFMWGSVRVDSRDPIGKLSRYEVELLHIYTPMKNCLVVHLSVN